MQTRERTTDNPRYIAAPAPAVAALLLAGVLVLLGACSTAVRRSGREFTLASYNVHNLFDDRTDGSEFAGYRPESDGWGAVEFHTKAERTAEALRKVGAGALPDIVALQEIENEHALGVLLREYLPRSGSRWFVMPPASGSSFRVAAVSRFEIRSARVHSLYYLTHPLRDVLELEIDIDGRHMTLFVNHWPSKRGGAELSAPLRDFTAAAVARRVSLTQQPGGAAAVVVAGDFNMEPAEFAPEWQRLGLHNPWDTQDFPGSYHFRGSWSRIDSIFLSDAAQRGTFELVSFSVIHSNGFLDRHGAPRVWRPGTSGGYSDHLPLLARLRVAH